MRGKAIFVPIRITFMRAQHIPPRLEFGHVSWCSGIAPYTVKETTVMASNKGGSTGSKVASAAAKVMKSKTASKAEKSAAASALTQKGSNEQTSAKAASSAGKVLTSKTASKSAKSAAASALSQKTKAKKA